MNIFEQIAKLKKKITVDIDWLISWTLPLTFYICSVILSIYPFLSPNTNLSWFGPFQSKLQASVSLSPLFLLFPTLSPRHFLIPWICQTILYLCTLDLLSLLLEMSSAPVHSWLIPWFSAYILSAAVPEPQSKLDLPFCFTNHLKAFPVLFLNITYHNWKLHNSLGNCLMSTSSTRFQTPWEQTQRTGVCRITSAESQLIVVEGIKVRKHQQLHNNIILI